MVEQGTHNPKVTGSIPVRANTLNEQLFRFFINPKQILKFSFLFIHVFKITRKNVFENLYWNSNQF